MTTPEILTDERKKRGYTQLDIAKYLNIARGSYAKYEVGINIPTTENVVKLAELYNLTTDYILGRNTPLPKGMQMFERSCSTCEHNIMGPEGFFICTGRKDYFEYETPITGIDLKECWVIDEETAIRFHEVLTDRSRFEE